MLHTVRAFILQLFDVETLEVLKMYKTERPINSAAISPIRVSLAFLFLGGGGKSVSAELECSSPPPLSPPIAEPHRRPQDHVLIGGGQDAMSVTTTSAKVGKFDAIFWHMVRRWHMHLCVMLSAMSMVAMLICRPPMCLRADLRREDWLGEGTLWSYQHAGLCP